MKKLTKIFASLVALVAVSCATDTTQDLGVDLGNNGALTEITLSLEESRTQLGEKAGDVYPLYWSEGDKIAINGVASAPLAASADGQTSATFSFDGTLERPFHIVYPAPADGVVAATTGLYPVTFPATQNYTVGTFESGTAPMYGYAATAAEGEELLPAVEIHHLTGILRLAVKGDKTLTSMTVVAETGAIAGNFDVNCESGALTAHEDASNTITLSFGEGLALGAEATPIYVAIPAGEHGIYTITLFTDEAENNAMVVRFNSDNHPVKAGVVKEFGEVIFIPNATASPVSGELVIENEADLVRLAKMSEVGLLGSVTSVRVAASLDMSNVEDWHGIDRFPAIPFDGGSDKGFEIKGLKAPLFITTEAQIKNVKLTDVNIYSKDRFILGAIACSLISAGTGEPASLTNCEVSGAITMDNEIALNEKYDSAYGVVEMGGLVGLTKGVMVTNCINHANATILDISSSDNHTALCPALAGIVGYASDGLAADGTTVTYTCIDNCENKGAVKYEDCAAFRHRPFVGGIVGISPSANSAGSAFTNCKNYGAIYFNGTAYGQAGQSGTAGIAGVAGGLWTSNISDCENRGTVTASGTAHHLSIGGVVGYTTGTHHKNLHNYGMIEVTKEARIIGVLAGGVGALMYGNADSGSTADCSNNGPIKVLASTMEEPKTGNYYYRIGGFAGFHRQPLSNCANNADGDVLVEGNIVNVASASERVTSISGGVAYKTTAAINKFVNYGDVTVNAHFSILTTDAAKIEGQPLSISGVSSENSYNLIDCHNHGNVTFSGSFTGYRMYLGGISANGIDANFGPASGAVNNGNITVSKDAVIVAELYMGGCAAATERNAVDNITNNGKIVVEGQVGGVGKAGRIGGVFGYATTSHSNLVNNGDIEFTETSSTGGATHIGGVVGRVYGKEAVFDGYTNNGNITKTGATTNTVVYAGVIGSAVSSEVKNMTNNGTLNIGGKFNGTIYAAGCIGHHDGDGYTVMTNIHNYKPVTISGENAHTGSTFVGGVSGYIQGKNTHKQLINHEEGDITIDFTKFDGTIYISGVSPKLQDKSENTENYGDIKVLGNYAKSVYIAGIVAQSNNYIRYYAINAGDIDVDAQIGGALAVGGMCSQGQYGATYLECKNTGDFTVSKNSVVGEAIYLGGMYGTYTDGTTFTFNKCLNSGNLTVAGVAGASDVAPEETNYNKEHSVFIGGLAGQTRNNGTKKYLNITDGFINTGKIEYTGSNLHGQVAIGGIIGDAATDTTAWTGEIVNTGDIIFTGTYKTVGYAGGIFGRTTVPVANAIAHCKVSAQALDGVGHISGSPRSATVIATNCKVGGKGMEYNAEEDDYEEKSITESNFHKYIYGGTTDWNGVVEYDGCTFLAEKPTFE